MDTIQFAVAAAMHAAILPQLGVLAVYAALLLSLPTWRLRRVLSG